MSDDPSHRILFLYSELAGYFLACAKELGKTNWVEAVKVIHWPMHPEAPFEFNSSNEYELLEKSGLSRKQLHEEVASFRPSAIVCSGWMDSDYNSVARIWRKNVPVVLTFDNWWTGSLKQRLAVLTSPIFIKRHFNRAWIPGQPQMTLAKRLGFAKEHISTGFYCADPEPFKDICKERQEIALKKKLLFVGRYLAIKGIRELWETFAELSEEHPDWELHCIGTGNLWAEREIHSKIIHHGFVQPDELYEHVVDAAAFVMPSHKEPWGVVLHEMAIAGLPLLANPQVGSASCFLQDNGIAIPEHGMREALLAFMSMSEDSLRAMGNRSHAISLTITPSIWASQLKSLL